MKNILSNAFSLQMVNTNAELVRINIEPVSINSIPTDIISAIGHEDTASVLSTMLCMDIKCNRINITLDFETVLYVAQLIGGRLPEGSTTLPEGFEFKFLKVSIIPTVKEYYIPEYIGYLDGHEVVNSCSNSIYFEQQMKDAVDKIEKHLSDWKASQIERIQSLRNMSREEICIESGDIPDSAGSFFLMVRQPKPITDIDIILPYISMSRIVYTGDDDNKISSKIDCILNELVQFNPSEFISWAKVRVHD